MSRRRDYATMSFVKPRHKRRERPIDQRIIREAVDHEHEHERAPDAGACHERRKRERGNGGHDWPRCTELESRQPARQRSAVALTLERASSKLPTAWTNQTSEDESNLARGEVRAPR